MSMKFKLAHLAFVGFTIYVLFSSFRAIDSCLVHYVNLVSSKKSCHTTSDMFRAATNHLSIHLLFCSVNQLIVYKTSKIVKNAKSPKSPG